MVGAIIGLGLVIAGLVLVVPPLWAVWQRHQADQNALNQWNSGGAQKLAGGGGTSYSGDCGTGDPSENYAKVTFPSLSQYGYAGVAANGTWNDLTSRSMVHYLGTAAPGQKGNDIIAFHREPEFQHIDQLRVGDIVDVQDRTCTTYAYRITQTWQEYPSQVKQLTSTDGYNITLITCTPFWVDTQRLVWRGELVTGPGAQGSPGATPQASG